MVAMKETKERKKKLFGLYDLESGVYLGSKSMEAGVMVAD